MSKPPHPPKPPGGCGIKHPRRPKANPRAEDMGPANEGLRVAKGLNATRIAALHASSFGAGDQSDELARHLAEEDAARRQGYTPASAIDTYAFRQRAIPTIVRLFTPLLNPGPLTFVTIIQPGWFFPIGELHRAGAAEIAGCIKQRLRTMMQLMRLPSDGLFVGVLEIGIRLDDNHEPAGYQLHIHAVADVTMMRVVDELSAEQFGDGSSFVRKPIDRREILCLERLQSRTGYCLKIQVRGMVLDGNVSQSTGDSGPTSQHEVRGPAIVEPLLWLDRLKFSDLLIVLGTSKLRSIGTMKARPQLYT